MKKRIVLVVLAVMILAAALQIVTESSARVEIYGQMLDINTRSVAFSGDEITSIDELEEQLAKLPKLEYVSLGRYRVPAERAAELRARFPGTELSFTSCVTLYGKTVDTDAPEIDLTDAIVPDSGELLAALPYMTDLRRVSFDRRHPLTSEERDELCEKYPDVEFELTATRRVCGLILREDSREIDLSNAAPVDIVELAAALCHFPQLERVSLGKDDPIPASARASLCRAFPNIEFNIVAIYELCGVSVRDDATEIDLSGGNAAGVGELVEALANFPSLRRLTLGRVLTVPVETKRALIAKYPDIEFEMVGVCDFYGVIARDDATTLDISGTSPDASLAQKLAFMPFLESVCMKNCPLSAIQQLELVRAFPTIAFDWDICVAGRGIDPAAETADLGGAVVKDLNEVRAAIELLPQLKYLDMSDCGISNEEMAAFRDEYENVKIVWRLYMGKWSLMTDAVAFSVLIHNFNYVRLTNEDIEVLKYCTDLRALDIGHQAITDLSVIGEHLTELRVLIIADNKVTDLTPLSNLRHLHYLEFFVNRVSDLSPLAECRELVDLNLSYNYNIWDLSPLYELPLLERVWLESCGASAKRVDALREKFSYSKIVNVGKGSVDQGWRTHERYYNMIDMFHRDFLSYSFSKYDGRTESLLREPLT